MAASIPFGYTISNEKGLSEGLPARTMVEPKKPACIGLVLRNSSISFIQLRSISNTVAAAPGFDLGARRAGAGAWALKLF